MNGSRSSLGRIVALMGALALLAALPGPAASAVAPSATHPLSGTESLAGHTVTWTIGGALPVPANRPDLLAYPYDGVIYQGSTVTLSGSETFTLGAGLVTNLDMTASLGFMMDAKDTKTMRKTVSAGTYTMAFDLTLKVPRSADGKAPGAPAVLNTVQALVDSRNCNDDGGCDGPEVIMYLALLPGKAPNVDLIAPTVRAQPFRGIVRTGKPVPAGYRALDSGSGIKVHADLYSGGALVASEATSGFVPSGREGTVRLAYPTGATGPFFYCLWGEDKAGNRSPGDPTSDCAWLSVEVPIGLVSNGCGTNAWGSLLEWTQNTLGDTRTYGGKTVEVKPACDLHDAAYVGATVFDTFQGKVVDLRTTSRKQADRTFLSDIRDICAGELKGAKHRADLTTCRNGVDLKGLAAVLGTGGAQAAAKVIGGQTYEEAVRTFGGVGYDWDATQPGTQQSMPSSTDPKGGGRNGA